VRLFRLNLVVEIIYRSLYNYLVPINLNYLWNLGVLAGLILFIQIITGILLASHYVPESNLAFSSIQHIMRDVNSGWLLRYVHANGASMFFLVVYIHMFRGFYYGSFFYPREILWISGVVILLLMIITAFLGYVLPWGQMSFWAATVITNLVSAVPVYGEVIVSWLWGGFAVGNPTLNRFFSLHYLLPFLLLGLVILHVTFLHENGSNNPLGISSYIDKTVFTPYFTIKDLLGIYVFFFLFFNFVFFYPNVLGHYDNYIPANPLSTPAHIVPEWYFLPFYGILRSVPDKFFGVFLLLFSIISLTILSLLYTIFLGSGFLIRSVAFSGIREYNFWFFFFVFIFLGWIGNKTIVPPFYELGQWNTLYYFFIFYFLAVFEKVDRSTFFWDVSLDINNLEEVDKKLSEEEIYKKFLSIV
jgi:quinol-cytochrome oxidoreductase complex cytochrome b subunit